MSNPPFLEESCNSSLTAELLQGQLSPAVRASPPWLPLKPWWYGEGVMTAGIFLRWTINPFRGHHAAWLLHLSCAHWSNICPSGLSILQLPALNCIYCLSHLKDANPPESGRIVLTPGGRSGRRGYNRNMFFLCQLLWICSDLSYEKTSKGVMPSFCFLLNVNKSTIFSGV